VNNTTRKPRHVKYRTLYTANKAINRLRAAVQDLGDQLGRQCDETIKAIGEASELEAKLRSAKETYATQMSHANKQWAESQVKHSALTQRIEGLEQEVGSLRYELQRVEHRHGQTADELRKSQMMEGRLRNAIVNQALRFED
jgi:predicted  nucleic acid-binding Zn-ribbon protein